MIDNIEDLLSLVATIQEFQVHRKTGQKQVHDVTEVGLIPPLVSLLQNADFGLKREATWAITNATAGGTLVQIKYLVDQEGLKNILIAGKAENSQGNSGDANLYAQMIEDSEGLEKIESLQNHDNNEIYEKAVKLLKTYWCEEESEILPSSHGDQSGFNFASKEPLLPPGGFNLS
ncbi:hypothetical protein RYX36_001732 [Vicia faba]